MTFQHQMVIQPNKFKKFNSSDFFSALVTLKYQTKLNSKNQ